jgi:tRNA(Ile)-lysidine synthase
MRLLSTLATFLTEEAAVRPGDGIVVAFSGGADSTALLHGLIQVAPTLGIRLHAAHLDHGLDASSADRAVAAAAAAKWLGLPCRVERRSIPVRRPGGDGLEAEARRVRYQFLEEVRRELGFHWIATAHHRQDQAETVLLRARFGAGPLGLGGIQRRRGAILRPLLDLDRAELRAALDAAAISWIEDPTNGDWGRPRNRLRRVLDDPSRSLAPDLTERLTSIAGSATRARYAVDTALLRTIGARREFDGASASLSAMRRLPSTLVSTALAALHREAGLAYPASRRATREICRQLARQLERGGLPGCDCGRGFVWIARGSRLHLARRPSAEPTPVLFTYTVALPGELLVEELSLRFRLVPAPEDLRVFEVSPRRTALALPDELGSRVTVRTRRPGDRIRPLGWDTSCRVKDLLINRKVSRHQRYRLPLLASGDDVIWIPGVALDERCRVRPGNRAWIAEIEPLEDARPGATDSLALHKNPFETLRIAR